jgi:hypothetical protein
MVTLLRRRVDDAFYCLDRPELVLLSSIAPF